MVAEFLLPRQLVKLFFLSPSFSSEKTLWNCHRPAQKEKPFITLAFQTGCQQNKFSACSSELFRTWEGGGRSSHSMFPKRLELGVTAFASMALFPIWCSEDKPMNRLFSTEDRLMSLLNQLDDYINVLSICGQINCETCIFESNSLNQCLFILYSSRVWTNVFVHLLHNYLWAQVHEQEKILSFRT